jgi:hypothetical protein
MNGGKRRTVAICIAAFVVVAGCAYNPPGDQAPLSAHFRNDSGSELIIELRWENGSWNKGSWNYRIPDHSRGSLGGEDVDVMVARVFTLDCQPVAVLELSMERSVIYVDSEGQASVIENSGFYQHPTPYTTELNLFLSERAAGCSGD